MAKIDYDFEDFMDKNYSSRQDRLRVDRKKKDFLID